MFADIPSLFERITTKLQYNTFIQITVGARNETNKRLVRSPFLPCRWNMVWKVHLRVVWAFIYSVCWDDWWCLFVFSRWQTFSKYVGWSEQFAAVSIRHFSSCHTAVCFQLLAIFSVTVMVRVIFHLMWQLVFFCSYFQLVSTLKLVAKIAFKNSIIRNWGLQILKFWIHKIVLRVNLLLTWAYQWIKKKMIETTMLTIAADVKCKCFHEFDLLLGYFLFHGMFICCAFSFFS